MIICPKCHAENLLTAVFCRNCGEKLDLDKLTPETLQDSAKKGRGGKLFGQVAGVVLVVVILGLAAGSLIPVSGVLPKAEPEKKAYLAYRKFISAKSYKGATQVSFTDEEASAVLTKSLISDKGQAGSYVPAGVTVHFTGDGYVKVLLTSRFTVLSLTTTVKALLQTEDGKAGAVFTPVSARFGYIPVPLSMVHLLAEKFQTAAEGRFGSVRGRIKEVSVSEGSIRLRK